MTNYSLKMFNTGQITLPKVWRDQFPTPYFIGEVTDEGLLIKPVYGVHPTNQSMEHFMELIKQQAQKQGLSADEINAMIAKLNA
jgi:hypothetical protein